MAILIDSPRGKGYTACCHGFTENYNPYHSIETVCEWSEWFSGWYEAFNDGRFGSEQ